jgi:hypothetical protein
MTMFDVVRQRMNNQRLVGAPFPAAEAVVGWLGAVQAQDFAGARWAVALRAGDTTDRAVLRAYEDGAILRTHVLRPTWHFVVPADLRWLLALSAPRIKQFMAPYDRKLELDERTYQRSHEVITGALAGGKHLTRTELAGVLEQHQIVAAGQRLGHLMERAEIDGVICSGRQRGKQTTYALVSERCPPTPPLARDEALGKLALRYFAGHGPALVHDFAWWSGLTITDARRAIDIAGRALSSRADGEQTYWFTESADAARVKPPTLHLLPNYDEYIVAYKDHGPTFDPSIAERLQSRDGVLANHVVVLDGKVIGGWRRTVGTKAATVTIALIARLDRAQRDALELAVARFGRFLELPTELVIEPH